MLSKILEAIAAGIARALLKWMPDARVNEQTGHDAGRRDGLVARIRRRVREYESRHGRGGGADPPGA